MTDVQMKKIEKSFGQHIVIPELDLTIPSGAFTVLVGPSGCGKSTLLRMVAGLDDPTAGALEIGGVNVIGKQPSDRGIAMVFQSYALYPHMSVRGNISFGLRLARTDPAEIDRRVDMAAEILQLTPLLDRKPKELSGGQRQRVAIGRAIVRDPKVFLFDEPLSNLDAALRAQMRVEIMDLHKRLQATMIYVTHDQVEAMTMADLIVVMNKGRIEQVGAPLELYDRPQTPFVAGFIGSPKMNFLTGADAERLGGDLVGVRPEDIAVEIGDEIGGTQGWAGRSLLQEQLGSDTFVHIDSEVGKLIVRAGREASDWKGRELRLSPNPEKLHVFRGGARVAAPQPH